MTRMEQRKEGKKDNGKKVEVEGKVHEGEEAKVR